MGIRMKFYSWLIALLDRRRLTFEEITDEWSNATANPFGHPRPTVIIALMTSYLARDNPTSTNKKSCQKDFSPTSWRLLNKKVVILQENDNKMTIYPKLITDALATVTYPGTKKNLVESNMVADNIRIEGNKVSFSLIFPRDTDPFIKSTLKAAEATLKYKLGEDVEVHISTEFTSAKRPEPDKLLPQVAPVAPTGGTLVQPFADSPVDRERVAKNVYLEFINQAQHSLRICTPYLILDNDLLTCLRLAAKRGVDVRIYTPGIPDKKNIYQLSSSYFHHILKAGVKIYSYTPGFLHAKTWLVDDRAAAVGTVNLDYRSLYLHFENSTVLYGGEVLGDIRRDLDGIERASRQLGLDDCRNGFLGNMLSACLRLIAPLC